MPARDAVGVTSLGVRRTAIGYKGYGARVAVMPNVNTATTLKNFVTLTASGTAHVKGSWFEIMAATTVRSTMMIIEVASNFTASTNTSSLLDIGVGAAASETVIVPNLEITSLSGNQIAGIGYVQIHVPVLIPKGVRVAARFQSAVISKTCDVHVRFYDAPGAEMLMPPIVQTYGANTATSRGVTPTAPGAANTKSAWTEITASTVAPTKAIWATFGRGGAGAQGTSPTFLVDIGVGAAGSEVVIVPDIQAGSHTNEQMWWDGSVYGVELPAGVRLAVRFARTTAEGFDVVLHTQG